jgi:hypothetical protein
MFTEMSALVEILDVSQLRAPEDMLAMHLGAPVAGDESATYGIITRGWALGGRAPVVAIEFTQDGSCVSRAPLGLPRPGVAAANPGVAEAARCGFVGLVNTLRLPREFELSVAALLEGGGRARLATVRGRRAPVRSSYEPRRQPLMVTTFGRTGSQAVMRLLEHHPEILVYRSFRYEQRIASYWIDVFLSLSSPESYMRQLHPPPDVDDLLWWTGAGGPAPPLEARDPRIQTWLGTEAVGELAAVCQERIESLYERIAEDAAGEVRYFAEKCSLRIAPLVWDLYPGTRELILVRDFRDMVASVLAFNAKRGARGFGRGRARSDADYVRSLRDWAAALDRALEQRADRAHVVRYEDLIERPADTLRDLLAYAGLDSSPATVDASIAAASEPAPELNEHATTPDARASIGRWRHDLDEELKAACDDVFGDLLARFGYEPTVEAVGA